MKVCDILYRLIRDIKSQMCFKKRGKMNLANGYYRSALRIKESNFLLFTQTALTLGF